MTDDERGRVEAFPVLFSSEEWVGQGTPVVSIPWSAIAPHEARALINHGRQSLRRLAQRGGLSVTEILAVMEDRNWTGTPMDVAKGCDLLRSLNKQEGEALERALDAKRAEVRASLKELEESTPPAWFKAKRQEGEARAAGETERLLALQSRIAINAHIRMEAAESLAKAEREQRESEGGAYRKEIEQLKAAVQAQKGIADMACEHAEAAETREFNLVQPFQDMIQKIEDEADQLRKERDEMRQALKAFAKSVSHYRATWSDHDLCEALTGAERTLAAWEAP